MNLLQRLAARFLTSRNTSRRRQPAIRPTFEHLEGREVPATLTTLTVENGQAFSRVAEPVRSGIPIPEALRLMDTSRLQILDAAGQAVPAQFSVTGRWNAGPQDATQPIRWLQVDFAANVPANSSATYRLDDAGNGSTTVGLQATQTAGLIDVVTGPARFQISRSNFDLFNAVWLDTDGDGAFALDEQIVAPNAENGSYVRQTGTEYRGNREAPRSVVLEESGPLRAVVRAEGFHSAANGADLLRYVTRMTFYAGQSYVSVDHTIIEGRVAGTGNDEFPNQVTTDVDRAGLRVNVRLNGAVNSSIRGAQDTVRQATLGAGNVAEIFQNRQTDSTAPMSYQVRQNGATVESGPRAARAWLDLSDNRWGLAVTTHDFWQKNPQRLRAEADGTVEVEFPSEAYRIYQAMGLGEQAVYYFHRAGTSTAEMQRVLEGFGKDTLLAVAPAQWMIDSQALGTLPGANLPAPYNSFDQLLEQSYQQTLGFINQSRATGLLNYFDLPSDGNGNLPSNPDVIGWGNSYYDPASAWIKQFGRTGETRWLKELTLPYVRHWYTTDAFDTDDRTSYQNGISGSRGAFHREAWTGEYHYLESLWNYYYLTGDRRALERGLDAAQSYANAGQWDINFDLGIGAPGITTRMAAQKLHTMLEGWRATGDANLRTALDNEMAQYLQVRYTAEGFVAPLSGARGTTYGTDQAWMGTHLMHNTVYNYYQATSGNSATRNAARNFLITVPQRVSQFNRVSQDPNSPQYFEFVSNLRVTVTSPGQFTTQRVFPFGNSDDFLYLGEKVGLATALARAAQVSGDTTLRDRARELLDFAVRQGDFVGGVWDKDLSKLTLRAFDGLGLAVGSTTPPPPPAGNRAPVLDAIGNRSVAEGSQLTFTARATDPDGDAVRYALAAGAPAGAAINATTGVFTWTPTAVQGPAAYDVTVLVSDGRIPAGTDSETIRITVTDGTPPPPPPPNGDMVLAATADNYFDGREGGDFGGNNGQVDGLLFYQDYTGGEFRPVLRFDFTSVPAGAQLTRAQLTLTHIGNEYGNGSLPVSIRALTRNWTETGSSWNSAAAGTPWTTRGGDVAGDGINTTLPAWAGQPAAVSFDVTALVGSWLRGERPNFGFLFDLAAGASDTVHLFASREHANTAMRPRLLLTFGETAPNPQPDPQPDPQPNPQPQPEPETLPVPGDVDGDGRADRVQVIRRNGRVRIEVRGADGQLLASKTLGGGRFTGVSATLQDTDDDGFADLVIRGKKNGRRFTRTFFGPDLA